MKRGPLDQTVMNAWNKGREAGRREAIEIFQEYLAECMDTLETIPGIGDRLALRIFEHFNDRMERLE